MTRRKVQHRAPKAAELAVACGLPILEPMEPTRLAAIAGPAGLARYSEETVLFSAGDPADRFFAVIEGSVRLYAATPDGRETTIALLDAPASFGEAAMFSSGVFPVNAAANPGTSLLHLGARAFLAELAAQPELGLNMLRAMRKWELRLLQEIREAKLMSPVQRLAGFLLALGGDRRGPHSVRLPFRKALLASKLGMQPETLSRNLQRLAAFGITTSGDTIDVSDPGVLLRLFRGETAES
jgi:CRP/FNR family transcriptional regulator, dissimilatory nitrate respiration regulator